MILTKEDRTPPQGVQKEARKILEWKARYGDLVKGGTRVGWTRANQLSKGEPLSEDTIKRMFQFFQRHEGNQKIDPKHKGKPYKDAGYTAWLLWGGDAGKRWATMMWNRIKKEKEKSKKESIIDHEKPTLNPFVWNEDETIKQEVKTEILTPILKVFKDNDVAYHNIYSINLVGSMASKRYRPDSDLDIHIMLKPTQEWRIDNLVDEIEKIQRHNLNGTKHLIEYFIEPYDSLKEYMFNYDIINDKWISRKEDLYIDIEYYRELIREKIRDFNDLLFELDSDVIDYEDIKYFADEKDPDTRKKLKRKITEIEDDMLKIRAEYEQIKTDRQTDYSDDDIGNITFKFLQKYNLLKRMRKISKLLDDGFQLTDIRNSKENFNVILKRLKEKQNL
jgi:predicted nucleotidyltransferase